MSNRENRARLARERAARSESTLEKIGRYFTGGATKEQLTSPTWWLKGVANAANENLLQPAIRTATGQNIRTAVAPSSTINQRINAVGEDALNLLSLIPMAGPAARASVAAERGAARALATARARAANKLTPSADLSTYIFHGGPTPDKLVGGVLDPDYVRGGEKFAALNPDRAHHASVAAGPNASQRRHLLSRFESAKNLLDSQEYTGTLGYLPEKPYNMSTRQYLADQKEKAKEAQEYLEKHDEIIRRILAGEEHQTGVHRSLPNSTYAHFGGSYLVDVPLNLQTKPPPPTPSGEVIFWGQHKPSGFVPYVRDEVGNIQESKMVQMMLDDADRKSIQSQGLANMLFRARGGQVTPAYKQHVQEVLDKEFGVPFRGFRKNPDYQGKPGTVEYLTDWGVEPRPQIQNMDQVKVAINKAKTKEEIMSILDKMIPAEQLDILLSSSNAIRGTFPELLQSIKERLELLDPSYARLKK